MQTINNKPYTQFDIKKRCAGIMGFKVFKGCVSKRKGDCWVRITPYHHYNPCYNWSDAGPIIDKVLDELLEPIFCTDKNGCEWYQSRWGLIMEKHNCTKLEAACICYIEINHSETT
jgi:hypothetical protein